MSDPVRSSPTSHSRRAPRPVSQGFVLGWNLFRISVWAAIVVWANPRLLDWVGGEPVARWLLDHRWVHTLCALPLGFLALISVFELIDDPRKSAAREEMAGALGGTLVKLRLDPALGIPDGPGLRVPLGRWFLVVGTWKGGGRVRTVATVRVGAPTSLSFVAQGTDREPHALRKWQQLALVSAANTPAFIEGPPITTGIEAIDRMVVLRANQPETVRALFTAGVVTSALAALDAHTRRWSWSFYPTETAGVAEMRLECPGSIQSDTIPILHALIGATLEEMAEAGSVAA